MVDFFRQVNKTAYLSTGRCISNLVTKKNKLDFINKISKELPSAEKGSKQKETKKIGHPPKERSH